MDTVTRRRFLSLGLAGAAALPFRAQARASQPRQVFQHGVASGDPLADRVILWTRVTPRVSGAIDVRWVLATDARLSRIVARGETRTGPARDYTVKVDAPGLDPGTTYYYRFEAEKSQSAIGRTKTLPAASSGRVRLGIASCSNLPFGYFNAYARLAERADLDAVLHLGDYIYEYRNARYGDGTAIGRIPRPDREIVFLDDYRARHAQYKEDPDLQEVHRQHPFIVVWDDHELANNTWKGGAENHDPDEGEGDWYVRRNAAMRAYFEWMPIRETAALGPQIYRTLRFGDLATLYMIDTRVVGRDLQAATRDAMSDIESVERSLLGAAQERWLAGQFEEAVRGGARWHLLGQQVMFAAQAAPGRPSPNVDSWDGYRASRDRVFDLVHAAGADNLVVLTGDVHSSWAYDLPRRPFDDYDPGTGRGSVGVEIVGTSITSPSTIGDGPDGPARMAGILKSRPHLKYLEPRLRGYVVVDLTRERMQADWFVVPTILERTREERFDKGFVSEAGRNHLVEAGVPVPGGPAADLAPSLG